MAFHSIAPQSAASTSSSKKSYYDVFINHRGPDVKHTLARNIYDLLVAKGVEAFLDQEELEYGDFIPGAIEEAIRSASVYIAIFSPRYAESPWCLEELQLMLQIKVPIIPVFYGVDPSDLRYVAKGKYADAFRQLERKRRYEPKKIKEWEEALSHVSYVSGCILDDDKCDEGKLLTIVNSALQKIKKVPLEVATFPVGLDAAIQNFESEVGSSIGSQDVFIVGILGMGGSGKTTLAKELFNRKHSSISRSSFLLNVREASSTNSLHKLQKKLFKDLKIHPTKFDNIDQGKEILKGLRSMTMLIILDDVDNVEQMEALLPSKDKLGRGSFIIVTTRELKVLRSWGISSVYRMKPLDQSNSKELFCRHAFSHPYSQLESEHSFDNFEDLIERFVKACQGLPLSLKVFGAMVNGMSKECWEAQLLKISRILPSQIVERLKISYEALDDEEKQMFLDIACFFIGGKKSLLVQIWDGSGWSGELGWQSLVHKCLVGLDKMGYIDMHDHLRDLGRKIASDVTPSRIWKEEQISILETPIRGIVTGTAEPWPSYVNVYSGFNRDTYSVRLEHCMEKFINRPSLPGLQLLAVGGNDFREEFAALSRGLVWLRWCSFEGSSLPSWLSLANLRVLELYDAPNLEELWQDNVQLPLQLRELIITGGKSFRGFPKSIGRLTHLKKIVFKGSIYMPENSMRSLPGEFCQLRSLEFLQLSRFRVLSSLPVDFGKLRNLRTLQFGWLGLTTLPDSFKQLTALQSLKIEECDNLMLSSEMLHVLKFMTRLQVLRITGCPQLEVLPHLTTQVSSLRELQLGARGLRELPINMDQLTKLKTLRIGSDNLTSLPGSLGELSCLTSLDIWHSRMLKSLPEALARLSNLRSLRICGTPVVEIPGLGMGPPSGCNLNSLKHLFLWGTGVCRISISDDCCPTLEHLYLYENKNLTEIETLPGSVRIVDVYGCDKLKSMRGIGGLLNLQTLCVNDCRELEGLPRSIQRCETTITDCPKVNNNNN